MKTRVAAIAIAIITALTLTSCKGRLTATEYKAAMEDAWSDYISSATELAALVPAESADDSKAEEAVPLLNAKADEAEKAVDKTIKALDEFKKINPPEEYEALHKKLIKGADDWEYEQCALQKKMFRVKNADELREVNTAFDKHSEKMSAENAYDIKAGTNFVSVYAQIVIKLREDNIK